MSSKIQKVLTGAEGNFVLPFFWQHGEDEKTLRHYMQVIYDANIRAVCVESRPHPDFCGEKWWQDMNVILDEARKRNMKVWILDDSHFPTGYANGALENYPDDLCRQSICCRMEKIEGGGLYTASKELLASPDVLEPVGAELFMGSLTARSFDDDKLVAVYAINDQTSSCVNLMSSAGADGIEWPVPDNGSWTVYTIHLSRNKGYHRNYINMLSFPSCRVLIDAVYEPHWEHYKNDFGTVIEGFFSDEPELGNGHMYNMDGMLGVQGLDYPWSDEMDELLAQSLGADYLSDIYLLWENDCDPDRRARIRYAYMDAVTKLVRKDFSYQLGNWCREHGVKYIGHMIEDNNQHCRTQSSLGHYFRGLQGQDWAGIDDIGGQVFPQGEDIDILGKPFGNRIGEFYHYLLGRLASSAAAIEPLKNGNSMCEIFGNYGWAEGVQLEQYLVNHFLVRGINHFVPHAFSAKEYPDPDCPPHFYAGGNNPQFRHFGRLMKYTNRLCELLSGGRHVSDIAVIYHGEGEWTGEAMKDQKIARVLTDHQIDFDIVPQDVFVSPDQYGTAINSIEHCLTVNTQKYKMVLIPSMEYITCELAAAIAALTEAGISVYVVGDYPCGVCNGKISEKDFEAAIHMARQISPDDIVHEVIADELAEVTLTPADNRIRYYHYEHADGSGILFFANEGTDTYKGKVKFADSRNCYLYEPWHNQLANLDRLNSEFTLELEPSKAVVVVLTSEDLCNRTVSLTSGISRSRDICWSDVSFDNEKWTRSKCRSIDYPSFADHHDILLPDSVGESEKYFSGYLRYENSFMAEPGGKYILLITEAFEGVEVFVNDKSLGIQIMPCFEYDISEAVVSGKNEVRIEVATTLQREASQWPVNFGPQDEPKTKSGITGQVSLIRKV